MACTLAKRVVTRSRLAVLFCPLCVPAGVPYRSRDMSHDSPTTGSLSNPDEYLASSEQHGCRSVLELRRETTEPPGWPRSESCDGAASPLAAEMQEVMSKRRSCHLLYVGRIAEVGERSSAGTYSAGFTGFPSASFAVATEQGRGVPVLARGGRRPPFPELANW